MVERTLNFAYGATVSILFMFISATANQMIFYWLFAVLSVGFIVGMET